MNEPARTAPRLVDVAELIDQQAVGRFQIGVLLLCASAMLVDGFDTQAIGYVAPALSVALAIKPAALGLVFAAGGLGAILGGLVLSAYADRVGRKPIIVGSMLFFAVCTLLISTANTVPQLMWMRFAIGLGLGGVVPNALALSAEFMPKKFRVTLVLMTWFGFSIGSGIAGPVTAYILLAHSWRAVFLFAGILPIVLAPLLVWRLPESLHSLTQRGSDRRRIATALAQMNPSLVFAPDARFINSEKKEKGFPVALLFREGRARITLLLWVMFFMNLLAIFFLNSWLPTVLHKAGLPQHLAIVIAALLHFGGIAGGLAIAPLCDRFNPYVVLAFAYILSGTFIAGIGISRNVALFAMATTFFAGFFTFGAQNTANAIAAIRYPTAMRSSGIGWALGIGRIGQIVGPLIGGFLLSLQWGTSGILYVIAMPSVVAATVAFFLSGASERSGFGAGAEAVAKLMSEPQSTPAMRKGEMNVDTHRITRISTHELERRWKLVRDHMKERGLGALIVQTERDFTGGYVKWFTDIPAYYPRTVVFHASDLMTVVEHGAAGRRRSLGGNDADNPGVGEVITTSAFPSVHYTQTYDAEAVSDLLSRRGYRKIGLVGASGMPHGFVAYLEKTQAAAEICDETEFIDHAKAVKSDEEIALITKAAEMQDAVFSKVLSQIKPGMRDMEVAALAQYEGQLLGSEQGIFLGMSAKLGQPAFFAQRHFQGRTIRPGDHMSLLIENNGAGAFYTEISRTIVLGKASQELIDGFEIVKEAQQHTLRKFKPGAPCREIFLAHNEFMQQQRAPLESRVYSHSQGYDLIERPLIRSDETMNLEKGMNMSVHPAYATSSMFAHICDNYLVEENGASECLHKTPKQIFEL